MFRYVFPNLSPQHNNGVILMFFNELKEGMTASLDPVVIDREEMLAFAKRFDDVPLHTDEEYAKKTHFGDIISPGMYSFNAVWAKYLEKDMFGEELLAGMSTSVEWLAPVYAGDTLTGKAVITALIPRSERNGVAEVRISVVNQHGNTVMIADTKAAVKNRI